MPAIREITIGTGGFVEVTVPIACDTASLRIPASAGSNVEVREDSGDATKKDTLTPGESYTAGLARRPGGNVRFTAGARICYAKAATQAVTGVLHCLDE